MYHDNEDAGDLSSQLSANAIEADYERKMDECSEAWRSLLGLVNQDHHDANCEECGEQMSDESCVETNGSWICLDCLGEQDL